MKTTTTKSTNLGSIFRQDSEQPVRLIKASQAGKFLGGGHAHNGAAGNGTHAKPEIRLVKAGADFCDLEIVCGCGESTQVRCWNSPAAQAAAAYSPELCPRTPSGTMPRRFQSAVNAYPSANKTACALTVLRISARAASLGS